MSISTPANGSSFIVPQDILVSATLPPNTESVVYTANGAKIGNGGSKNGFVLMWTVPSGGTYTIVGTAKDVNANVFSAASTITAIQDVPPSVAVTWPTSGMSLTGPVDLALAATSSSSYGPTSIEFYNGTTKLGKEPGYTWNNVPAGTYTITAVATDIYGVAATSAPVTFTVTPDVPPTVAISSPANGAIYPSGSTVTFQASAMSSTGNIETVTYYNGSAKIKVSSISPYQINWTKVTAGTYTITAVAVDNYGTSTTSAPVTITVTP